jgi:hypothetical protein
MIYRFYDEAYEKDKKFREVAPERIARLTLLEVIGELAEVSSSRTITAKKLVEEVGHANIYAVGEDGEKLVQKEYTRKNAEEDLRELSEEGIIRKHKNGYRIVEERFMKELYTEYHEDTIEQEREEEERVRKKSTLEKLEA